MEQATRLCPLDVVAVVTELKLGRLLAQGVHVLDQETEGSVLIAASLGEAVVAQQTVPQALAQVVDRLQVDRAQPQSLGQARFIQGFAGQQDSGEHQDFGAGGDVEQGRAVELLGPGTAVKRRHLARCGQGTETQEPGRE
ncbi:hypothetical protein PS685_05253 [Pseudomonas fluorescens]|uniref:Uncharacterized protein n=1 Tax=Pseudomonas fluorescens TaxID=294 RepID=A0A5E7AK39_PSEFL|nr:hypothetical protein PS685_05253 [Pseudomonas fluorescens]